MTQETHTLVVGASAAGLAAAACLKARGVAHELLERSDAVGATWRNHYDRLHLHTPKSSSSLPGLPMPAEWPRYPAREQVVDYLERYVAHHGLAPRFGHEVRWLAQEEGGWVVETSEGDWRARNVVVATGYTRVPVRPTWPGLDAFGGEVIHSSEYKNGARFTGRPVLVVGFGNSACEQAIDLAEHGATPHMSVRSPVNVVPRDLFGVVPVLQLGIAMRYVPPAIADALSWPLVRLTVGDITRYGLRKLPYGPNAQIARDRHIPLLDIGTMDLIRRGVISVHGDISRFIPGGVVFTDGTEIAVEAVVLATGYRPGLEAFLEGHERVTDDKGVPLVSGGPTALPGLYFCGLFVSPAGMIREAGLEARRIASHIALA